MLWIAIFASTIGFGFNRAQFRQRLCSGACQVPGAAKPAPSLVIPSKCQEHRESENHKSGVHYNCEKQPAPLLTSLGLFGSRQSGAHIDFYACTTPSQLKNSKGRHTRILERWQTVVRRPSRKLAGIPVISLCYKKVDFNVEKA